MSGPITWRNVHGPSLAEAARPMELANQSINNAFARAQNTLDSYQKQYQAIEDRQEQGRLLDAKELLQGATTPEQVEALREQLAAARSGMSNESRAALLGAEEARIASLQERILNNQKYADNQLAREEAPTADMITGLIYSDPERAKQVLPHYANIKKAPELAALLRKTEQENTTQNRATTEFGWKTEDRGVKKDSDKLAVETQYANLQLLQKQLNEGRKVSPNEITNAQKLIDGELARIVAADTSISNPTVQEGFWKRFDAGFKGSDKDGLIRRQVSDVLADPRFKDLSADALLNLANKVSTSGGWFGSNKHLVDDVKEYMKTDDYKAGVLALNRNREQAAQLGQQSIALARQSMLQGTGQGGSGYRPFYSSTPLGGGNTQADAPHTGGTPTGNVKEFVASVTPAATKVAQQLGVPVEAVIGQWGLETGWGKSVIPGTNNLGNIKDFSGKGTMATDNMTGSRDAYRQYNSVDDFVADKVRLLGTERYKGVPGAKNAEAYFTGLKAGGYAEDPDYVAKGVSASDMVRRTMGDIAKAELTAAQNTSAPESVDSTKTESGNKPVQPEKKSNAILREQAQLEWDEIQTKQRKDYSPEVASFLESEKAARRQEAKQLLSELGYGTGRAAGVLGDVGVAPLRALANAYNTVADTANIFDGGLPRISAPALTNYDHYSRAWGGQTTSPVAQEVQKRRAAFDARVARELGEDSPKKAK